MKTKEFYHVLALIPRIAFEKIRTDAKFVSLSPYERRDAR